MAFEVFEAPFTSTTCRLLHSSSIVHVSRIDDALFLFDSTIF